MWGIQMNSKLYGALWHCDNWKPQPGDAMEPRPGGVLSRTRSNSSDATEILKMKILETNSWNQPTILEKMQVHIKCK